MDGVLEAFTLTGGQWLLLGTVERGDLHVRVAGTDVPTPFGFGGFSLLFLGFQFLHGHAPAHSCHSSAPGAVVQLFADLRFRAEHVRHRFVLVPVASRKLRNFLNEPDHAHDEPHLRVLVIFAAVVGHGDHVGSLDALLPTPVEPVNRAVAAGIIGLPRELFQAAELDGAGAWAVMGLARVSPKRS